MEFQDTIKNYRALNLKEGYKGFEGNELDLIQNQNVKITVRQVDLNKKNSTFTPSLQVVLRDTIIGGKTRSYDITYKYFFDGEGKFIAGFCQGYIGRHREYFQRKKLDSLEHLSNNGETIKNMLEDRAIPKQLLEYKIINSLRDNTVKTDDYEKKYF